MFQPKWASLVFPCTPNGLLLDGVIVGITKLVGFVWRCIFTIGPPGYSTLWTANSNDVSEKTVYFRGLWCALCANASNNVHGVS